MKRYPERRKIEKGRKIDYSQEGLSGWVIEELVDVKKGDAFPKARGIEAKEVKAGRHVFLKAEDCKVEKVGAGEDAFPLAKRCEVGYVEAGGSAFSKAGDCRVKKVETGENANAFTNATRCEVEEVKAGKYAFWEAKKCLVEKVKAEEIGKGSLGVVVLGEAEGKVFPSAILMKGKLKKEKPEEIERFFKEELKKSQQGEESIFDYLSFFGWEGKTLKEGEEILKQRYERVKEKRGILEELRKYNFYFLIDDNSKREEILFGFERLKEKEKKALLALNNCLPQLKKVKKYLPALSLKDWIKLGVYAEFLDFDKEKIEAKIKEGEKKLEDLKLDEIEEKKTHLVREVILNSPKENLISYLEELKKWGIKIEIKEVETGGGKEIAEDTIIAASFCKRLEKEEEEERNY